MNRKKKLLIIIPTVILLLISGGLLYVGNYLVDFAIVRSEEDPDVAPESIVSEEDASIIATNRAKLDALSDAWIASCKTESVNITSDDGLNLVGEIYWNEQESHKWLIGVHGYTSSKEEYNNTGYQYAKEGYNVLLFDQRSHGESEGKYIGMGWLEKDDLLNWIDFVIEKDNQAQIILHGTSMGGATVMMTSGEALPSNVKGIVEDCGYTSVWDMFANELDYLYGLPTFPVLNAAQLVAQIRAGYNFKEASCVEAVKKATVPMLFIHGGADSYVLTDMVYDVYEACPTTKDILIVEGAGHAESYQIDPELYYNTVFNFIEENCITE